LVISFFSSALGADSLALDFDLDFSSLTLVADFSSSSFLRVFSFLSAFGSGDSLPPFVDFFSFF